jgi:hypothetical protein
MRFQNWRGGRHERGDSSTTHARGIGRCGNLGLASLELCLVASRREKVRPKLEAAAARAGGFVGGLISVACALTIEVNKLRKAERGALAGKTPAGMGKVQYSAPMPISD